MILTFQIQKNRIMIFNICLRKEIHQFTDSEELRNGLNRHGCSCLLALI